MALLLVEDDGDVVASSASGASRDDDASPSVGEVRSFFVAAGHWQRGIGRILMASVLGSLRERGYSEATLWSFAANDRANAFYESLGFERDAGAEKREAAWAHLPEVRYRRTL